MIKNLGHFHTVPTCPLKFGTLKKGDASFFGGLATAHEKGPPVGKRPSPSQQGKGNKSPKSAKDKQTGAKALPIKGKNNGTKPVKIFTSTPIAQQKSPSAAPVTKDTTKTSPIQEQKPPGTGSPRSILKANKLEQSVTKKLGH